MDTGITEGLLSIWGSSPDDVFAVGEHGTILHYDGSAWTQMDSDAIRDLNGVWGSGPDDVFAVGSASTIIHYDGTAWSAMDSGISGGSLYDVWGSGPNDVFAVGSAGTIVHYDGTSWSDMDSGITSKLYGVWGSGSNDVFVVGGDDIIHYDGTSWSAMDSGTTERLYSVWGSGPDDVFAVGKDGTIVHYDGISWSQMDSGTTTWQISGIWGSAPDDVVAVGWENTVLHYDGASWSQMDSNIPEIQWLKGAWVSPGGEVFIVSDYGKIRRTNCTPAYYDDRIYLCGGCVGYEKSQTYCFDASTGDLIWETPPDLVLGNWTNSVAVADGKLFVGTPGHFFGYAGTTALDIADGSVVWSYSEGGSSPAVANGRVFTTGEGGKVYCLGPVFETYADWDVNQDGRINMLDIGQVGLRYGESGDPGWIREDVNDDGRVNMLDVGIIGIHYGE